MERERATKELVEFALIVLGLAFALGFSIPEFGAEFRDMWVSLKNRFREWENRARSRKLRQLTLTFFC